jgi:transcription elongation factor Elf1
MKPNKIKGEKIKENVLRCPDCGKLSGLSEWQKTLNWVECETCGEHDIVICPKCEQVIESYRDDFDKKGLIYRQTEQN